MGNSSSAALPYSIDKEEYPAKYNAHHSGWALHSGTKKKSSSTTGGAGAVTSSYQSQSVTVFKFSKTANLSSSQNPLDAEVRYLSAKHHFQKIKTLVHPHLLRAYATLDTDNPDGALNDGSGPNTAATSTQKGDFIIVTEEVVPLPVYIRNMMSSPDVKANSSILLNSISWGLVTIIEALHFLHATAKLSHGRVCVDSIYVTPAGDFKLADFSLLTAIPNDGSPLPRHFRDSQSILTPQQYQSPERIKQQWDLISACPPHVMDSYSLGILIQELYTTHIGKSVPQKLVKATQRLTTQNVKLRPRIAPLLKCPVFEENPLVKINSFLDNIAAKPSEEKIAFMQGLPDLISRNVVHPNLAEYKVLPEMVRIVDGIVGTGAAALQQDVSRREIMAIIPPLYQITNNIVSNPGPDNKISDSFPNLISPLIITLFSLNDRGIRGAILARFIPLLASNFPPASLNSHIFEPMCTGFTDSSSSLRELTLKSALHLVPHLKATNTEKLCRYLIRLQSDAEASIRTNTIIFVGKISTHLSDAQRSNLILPAFTRAMGDGFTPCRLAALKSVSSCIQYFDFNGIATKVLPTVVPHLVDNNEEVRNEAFSVVDAFMVILKKESEERVIREANNEDGSMSSSAHGVSSMTASEQKPDASSSSYFSGFSSWASGAMSSSTTSAPAPVAAPVPSATRNVPSTSVSSNHTPSFTSGGGAPNTSNNVKNNGWSDDDGGGFDSFNEDEDDGWGDDSISAPAPAPAPLPVPRLSNPTPTASKLTMSDKDDDLFAAAFAGSSLKVGGTSSGSLSSSGRLKMNVPKTGLSMNTTTNKSKGSMSLAERKQEFERRKLERMEKRMREKEKEKEKRNAAANNFNGF